MPVRLFALPIVPLAKIIHLLSIIEILELSECSKKTHRAVRSQLAVTKFRLKVVISHSGSNWQCSIRGPNTEFFVVIVWCQSSGPLENARDRKFCGRLMSIDEKDGRFRTLAAGNVVQHGGAIADYLFSFFHVTSLNYTLILDEHFAAAPSNNLYAWHGAKNAGNFKLICHNESELAVFREILTFFGSNRRKNVYMVVKFDMLQWPRNLPPFAVVWLDNRNCGYKTPLFPNFDVRFIRCTGGGQPNDGLTVGHHNEFLKKWLSDREFHERLEAIVLEDQELDYSENGLLRDVQLLDIDETRRANKYWVPFDLERKGGPTFDCSNGRDIRRAVDGKMATLIMEPKFYAFLVWPS